MPSDDLDFTPEDLEDELEEPVDAPEEDAIHEERSEDQRFEVLARWEDDVGPDDELDLHAGPEGGR